MGFTNPVKTLCNMKNQPVFFVSPNPVPSNACITIQMPAQPYSADNYRIINEQGQLIRKGKITDSSRDLLVSVGGMPDGTYWLEMGELRERFSIV
jgi:hypothetical protein